jgi:hypothetical protein
MMVKAELGGIVDDRRCRRNDTAIERARLGVGIEFTRQLFDVAGWIMLKRCRPSAVMSAAT